MGKSVVPEVNDEYVYRVAPDGKSAQAGLLLAREGAFAGARVSADGTRLEARCRGSGPRPYTVAVNLADFERPETGCDCGSLKRPCKHAIGLLFLAAHKPEAFAGGKPRARSGMVGTPARSAAEDATPPTDAGDALLQAILTDREDMTPRLVYADWLEDHGGAAERDRAEFIRVQMELEAVPQDGPAWKKLRARERALWKAHGRAWLSEEGIACPAVTPFRRGFYEELLLRLNTRPQDAGALVAHHPISRLRITTRMDRHRAGDLAVVPQFAHLRELLLVGCPFEDTAKSLQILLSTPFLSGLTRLTVTNCGLTTRDLAVVLASLLLAKLRSADLAGNDIGPGGVEQLAGADGVSGLRHLSLAGNPIRDAGARALAASRHLGGLEVLDLTGCELGRSAREALTDRFGERVRLG